MLFVRANYKWLIAAGALLAFGLIRVLANPDALPAPRAPSSVFRSLAANIMWVRAYVWWDRRAEKETIESLWRVVKLNPEPLHFWLNGARMMAYDIPVWTQDGGAVERTWLMQMQRKKMAREAIRFLDAARRQHPDCSALWIEQGNIELNSLHDVEAAAMSYRRASEIADAPYYAARIHAELLKRAGRKAEAYDWLRKLHARLPIHDPEAASSLVLRRIRELEADLPVPPADRYRETER